MKLATLIVVPLKKEMQFLLEALAALGHASHIQNLSHMSVRKIPSLSAIFGVAGHGKAQFAVQAQYLLQHTQGIKQIIGVGSAGSLTENTNVGDLVISRQTIEHDYTEKFSPHPCPAFPGHPRLMEIAAKVKCEGFNVLIGNIASGDEDIIDTQRAKILHQQTEGLAVAWEGAGLARASLFMNTPHLEIRAITDHANKSTPTDFNANLELAMKNSAHFLIRFLDELNAN